MIILRGRLLLVAAPDDAATAAGYRDESAQQRGAPAKGPTTPGSRPRAPGPARCRRAPEPRPATGTAGRTCCDFGRKTPAGGGGSQVRILSSRLWSRLWEPVLGRPGAGSPCCRVGWWPHGGRRATRALLGGAVGARGAVGVSRPVGARAPACEAAGAADGGAEFFAVGVVEDPGGPVCACVGGAGAVGSGGPRTGDVGGFGRCRGGWWASIGSVPRGGRRLRHGCRTAVVGLFGRDRGGGGRGWSVCRRRSARWRFHAFGLWWPAPRHVRVR